MNGLQQECLVLSASTYSVKDEKTGETNSGLTIFYLPTDNLSPVEDEQALERGEMSRGLQPAKVSLPLKMKDKVFSVPGLYGLTLRMVTRQLRTQIQPVDIQFICDVDMRRTQQKDTK